MANSDIAIIFGFGLLMLLILAVAIAINVFWILMIIDCAKNKKLSDSDRVVWILVLVFLTYIGASIYYLAVKRQ